ncbi:MAG: NAD(P)/FAD-dependent oxidoreductase [Candidatus Izemoplasmatales bacterium]|nr:NAD(P)/FAD-dependent oxidoreductase [bacterium]MDZ4197533.1 NAD(P)/FAD-dependent oxidoreductase [Candidatus Izemoplasmatales bacterium]
MFDVLIIGGGVIGCSVAKYLSEYQLKIGLLEKASDVCELTSKANSGIVHSGIDAHPGSLKATLNLQGNQMMESFCKELDVPFIRNGSLILCFEESDYPDLLRLYDQGVKNEVPGIKILNQEELLQLEPNLNPHVYAGILAPSGGIVDPFKLTLMQAEVASTNGVSFFLQTTVFYIQKKQDYFQVETSKGVFQAKLIVNAAGIYADEFNNQVSNHILKIIPRKGEYCLFDKQVGSLVKHTIFQLPTPLGKGVVVTPTTDGNLLLGPTAYDILDKEDISTTVEGLKFVVEKGKKTIKEVPMSFVITAFAGLRATEANGDFILGESQDVPNFFNAAGMESPGLSAAPAIGVYLGNQITTKLRAKKKDHFVTRNKSVVDFDKLSLTEKARYIENDHDFGQIVCRCELVTLAQIKEAIHRPLGATTIDGIKRRTRAGSGRCQGGFCSPRILDILSKELHKDPKEIAKSSEQSTYLVGLDKELL